MLEWLTSLTPGSRNRHSVTIVVPVYGDWQSLQLCIGSLKKYTPKSSNILFVNDCGPEVDQLEQNILRSIRGTKNFKYFRNPENLGFVRTCNRAVFELDESDNDILLLNSDTQVTSGFLKAMTDVLSRADNVASVSPRSNKATVFSVPFEAATDYDYPPQKSYDLYKLIRTKLPEFYETPTTHGFCMLIRRSVIKKYGLFDEAFGKGYGEENDFCMRVRHHGYTHMVANRAYVFHIGSRSFTKASRDERVATNNKIIEQRYPEYSALIDKYIQEVVIPEQALFADKATQ